MKTITPRKPAHRIRASDVPRGLDTDDIVAKQRLVLNPRQHQAIYQKTIKLIKATREFYVIDDRSENRWFGDTVFGTQAEIAHGILTRDLNSWWKRQNDNAQRGDDGGADFIESDGHRVAIKAVVSDDRFVSISRSDERADEVYVYRYSSNSKIHVWEYVGRCKPKQRRWIDGRRFYGIPLTELI